MASLILDLLLSGIIKSDILILWLDNRLGKEDVPDVLANMSHLKTEFVPYFLGYLREQATAHIHDLQHSGLTPRKNFSTTRPAPRNVRSPESDNSPPFRTKLSFGSTESANDGPPQDRTALKSESWSRRKSRQGTWGKQELQRTQGRLRPEQKSQQKLSLGNFILDSDLSPAQKLGSEPIHDVTNEDRTKGGMPNLNDQSAFPPVGSATASKRNQNARRITPTPLKQHKNYLPGASPILPVHNSNLGSNNSIFTKSPTVGTPGNFHLERELLKEKREKMQQSIPLHNTKAVQEWPSGDDLTPCRFLETDTGVVMAQPHPNDVKFRDQIEILAEIYSGCINANLAPSIVAELHFAIQLFTVVGKCEPDLFFDSGTEPFFCSLSNCIYFATRVLWLLRKLLYLLDRGTLRLLLENPRLELFSPQLTAFLTRVCKSSQASISSNVCESLAPVGSVPFQSDTDNRNNFVNDQEFHTFRRKRDLFYEVLREWEANHLSSGWSMALVQGGRIRSLVLGGEQTASGHLARLFLAQLIAMCKSDVQLEDCNLDGAEPLAALKQSNPEKYKRLQERFVMPYHSGGPCPPPSFPGYQEFFKDFISTAASHSFNQQLSDSLCSKIHEMNAFQLVLTDRESDEERNVDADSRNQFLSCLLTLRLLAKFLGFVHFSPYRTNERIPENVLASQILLRSNTNPPINITTYLKDAIKFKRIVLGVPWIVEFLSMIDPVAPFLPYFQKPLEILVRLYRSEMLTVGHPAFSHNQFFIVVLLGWLFEVVNFWPAASFIDAEVSPLSMDSNLFKMSSVNALDTVGIIDQSIVYTCCPYLVELRILLLESAKGTNSRSGTVRKIKPVTTEHSRPVQSSTKQMELQLEENFFHNHPVSLKKMVEFVTDRISSNVIKHVRNTIVAEVRLEASRRVGELGESLEMSEVSQKSKMLAAKKIVELSQKVAEDVKTKTHAYANEYCPKRANAAVPVLLPDETLRQVSDTCVKIVQRSALKKISQWITTNITSDVFYKELLHELQKIIKNSSSYKSSTPENEVVPEISKNHNEDVPAPADILISSKEILKYLYSGADLNESIVEEIVDAVRATGAVIESRSDLTPLAFRTLIILTVDIAVGILIQHPGLMASSLEDIFIEFWRRHEAHVIGPLATIFCPRNLQFLSLAKNCYMSFAALEGFVNKCIAAELIIIDDFRKQCHLVLKQPWPKRFLLQMANFVRTVLERDPEASIPRPQLEFDQLDRWLSEFCQTSV